MSCPEGLRPSADYVTCELGVEFTESEYYNGGWKYPPGVKPHGIFCLEGPDESTETPESTQKPTKEPTQQPTSETTNDLLCEDLSEKYYDETVEVSFSESLLCYNDCNMFLFEIIC